MTQYKRILLKLSGESLRGESQNGIDPLILESFAKEILPLYKAGVQIAIVIGGGNIFRGLEGYSKGFDRVQGDYMGMLATVINGMAMQSVFEQQHMPVKILSGIEITPVCDKMDGRLAIELLEQGKVVIITGGTGNPFFTTDTAAALRAVEIKSDVILKGTRVDGVYCDDPEKNPEASKFDTVSFDEVYRKKLKVMDMTAFTICYENNMPIIVFNMGKKNNLSKIVIEGKNVGTIVKN